MSLPVQITVREAGRRGGQSTLEHQGVEFYREIGKKGGRRTAELYHDLLAEFGKRGGRPRRPTLNQSDGEEGH
jgi:general stress protein YciG